jgi:hypothetical protein
LLGFFRLRISTCNARSRNPGCFGIGPSLSVARSQYGSTIRLACVIWLPSTDSVARTFDVHPATIYRVIRRSPYAGFLFRLAAQA